VNRFYTAKTRSRHRALVKQPDIVYVA